MTNHIIVDGHNYIFQTGGNHLRQSREDLLFVLAEYRRIKNVEITVVFDNRSQDSLGNEKSHYRGIQVIYSSPSVDADIIINKLVEKEKNRRRITVVTTDRAHIGSYCSRMGTKVIPPGDLKKLLDKNRKPAKKVSAEESEKPTHSTTAEIDYYLKKFGGK